MKILRITLRNLASLAGTHTVDFTREPLVSTGLFAISGPTGAGKSTLLDALCLALYEDTPRLGAATGAQLPDLGGVISQRDPGNLLRRGAAEAFAEVAFVGVDSATYTARWSIRRARLSATGALQATEMALFQGNVPQGTEGVLAHGGTKREVLAAITAKVGLTFAQFTRAVLLAQNDFAVFLKAEDRERAQILQALTGTERFERLSIAVFQRERTERAAIAAIEAQLAGHAPLAPEARATAEAALAATNATVQSAQAQLTLRSTQAAWFAGHRERTAAATAAEVSLAEARRAADSAAPRRAELAVTRELSREARPLHEAELRESQLLAAATHTATAARAHQTHAATQLADATRGHAAAKLAADSAQRTLAGAAPELQKARALDAQLIPLAQHLSARRLAREAAELALTPLASRIAELTTQLDTHDSTRARLTAQRMPLAHLAPVLPAAPAWIERLHSAHSAREQLGLAAKAAGDATARIASLDTAVARALAAVAEREATRRQNDAALQPLVAALAALDPEALAAERHTLDADHAALTALHSHLTRLAELSTRHHTAQAELAATQSLLTRDTALATELKTSRLPAASAALAATQSALAAAEAAVSDTAALLREKLLPDHPCPVCGATHHPFSQHPPVLDAALTAIRSTVQEKQTSFTALQTELTRLEASLAANTRQAASQTTAVATAEKSLAHERLAAPSHAAALAALAVLALPEPERLPATTARLAALATARSALATREARHRETTKAHAAASRLLAAATAAVVEADQARADFAAQHAAAVAALTAAQQNLTRDTEAATSTGAALYPLFELLPATARHEFTRSAASFISAFTRDTEALQRLDLALAETSRLHTETQLAHASATREHRTADAALASLRADESAALQAHENLRTQRAALLAGRPADTVEAELRSALEKATAALDLATSTLRTHQDAATTAGEAARQAELAATTATTRHTVATTALDAWLTAFVARHGRALDRAALTVTLARDEAWCRAEQTALDGLAAAVATAEGIFAERRARLATHLAERPTDDDESTVTADLIIRQATLAEAERAHVAAAAILHADDRRRLDCTAFTEKLAAQQIQAAPWAQLNDLIGSADGAKFRAIAQRRTLDLLLGFANAQLDLLSARYRIERLPESLNLLVLDRDMADERRSVHSLSGGESFLVSLALALGLASLTSNRIRIESLFIDEGFGSLDPATLHTAMNALMHLEAQGRKVGVISHVSEMADAIPVQIRVVKGRSGASRLEVPGAAPAAAPADDSPPPASVPKARATAPRRRPRQPASTEPPHQPDSASA